MKRFSRYMILAVVVSTSLIGIDGLVSRARADLGGGDLCMDTGCSQGAFGGIPCVPIGYGHGCPCSVSRLRCIALSLIDPIVMPAD
jgi:hypothetical protein